LGKSRNFGAFALDISCPTPKLRTSFVYRVPNRRPVHNYWSLSAMNEQVEQPEEGTDEQPVTDEVSTAEFEGTDQGGDAAESLSGLEKAELAAAENWDRYLRTAAELENVRKRASRDVENARRFALERFSRELLAVRDSLEMGLAAEGASVESLLEGSEATLKILSATMQQFGIEVVDPAGEPFDPDFHEAISMQPSDAVEPGSVATVVQKGYSLNGRLLRPAMVVVAAE
jgi:molecular chaperone GrpE